MMGIMLKENSMLLKKKGNEQSLTISEKGSDPIEAQFQAAGAMQEEMGRARRSHGPFAGHVGQCCGGRAGPSCKGVYGTRIH